MAKTRPTPKPFSRFEFLIAWRYLRARKAEGGVGTMTWISLIGITLAVAALIITLAVRSGFRDEFVGTILGANAHVTLYSAPYLDANGQESRALNDFDALARTIAQVPGVTRAAPLVKGQVMANAGQRNTGVEVFGIRGIDLRSLPGIASGDRQIGNIDRFEEGIAIGSGVAQRLGAGLGSSIKLISPNGIRTAFGTSPRVSIYEITYIFNTGRFDIDSTRIYMPLSQAQIYFDKPGVADEIEVMVTTPEEVDALAPALREAGGPRTLL
ncbi:MAG: ABC transporter permease, partial [Pseudomonadota bacterium]